MKNCTHKPFIEIRTVISSCSHNLKHKKQQLGNSIESRLMDYNSTRKKLVLPEYGRHIQNMVLHAVSIEDKEERTKCARSIIGIMGNLFPHLRDISDFKHKLWDHLAIMSDYKLDINYPYEPLKKEEYNQKPERVPYKNNRIRYMHYGKMVEQLIGNAVLIEDETERNKLTELIANHMKKSLMIQNRDSATDERIINDIKELSGGKLSAPADMKIAEFTDSNNTGSRDQSKFKKRRPPHKNDRRNVPQNRNQQQ